MTDSRPEEWWLLLEELRAKADAEDPARRVVPTVPPKAKVVRGSVVIAEEARKLVERAARSVS